MLDLPVSSAWGDWVHGCGMVDTKGPDVAAAVVSEYVAEWFSVELSYAVSIHDEEAGRSGVLLSAVLSCVEGPLLWARPAGELMLTCTTWGYKLTNAAKAMSIGAVVYSLSII